MSGTARLSSAIRPGPISPIAVPAKLANRRGATPLGRVPGSVHETNDPEQIVRRRWMTGLDRRVNSFKGGMHMLNNDAVHTLRPSHNSFSRAIHESPLMVPCRFSHLLPVAPESMVCPGCARHSMTDEYVFERGCGRGSQSSAIAAGYLVAVVCVTDPE
jgi:hypothetical protein